MANRRDFFRRLTVKEILAEREIIWGPDRWTPRNKELLVKTIRELGPGQALLLPETCNLVQFGDEPPAFANWQKALKRGRRVYLPWYGSAQEAIQRRADPQKLMADRFGRVKRSYDEYGYGFGRFREGKLAFTTLLSCIQGAWLFAYTCHQQNPEDRISFRSYEESDGEKGGKYLVEVPSRSTDTRYTFRLESVPLTIGRNGRWQHVVWYDLNHTCPCMSAQTMFSFRHKLTERFFCPHAIAAYFELTRVKREMRAERQIKLIPFAVPTRETVSFWRKLWTQAVREVRDEKGRLHHRPLNWPQIEVVLWCWVAVEGFQKAFHPQPSTRIRDYPEWGFEN